MARKQDVQKRRVAAEKRADARRQVEQRRERRRRLMIGGVVGFLALALVLPLTAGILLAGDDTPTIQDTTSTFPEIPWLPPAQAGASITGPTPCPATDGTADRTTQFDSAPPMCIAEDSTHDLTFTSGDATFSLPVDAGLDPTAANLAVTFAHYRTYEQVQITTGIDGLLWIGSDGDAGFTIPGGAVAGGSYPVGSVVMVADVTGRLWGTIAVVLDELGSTLLQVDPRHVVIGTVDDVESLAGLADARVTEVSATSTR